MTESGLEGVSAPGQRDVGLGQRPAGAQGWGRRLLEQHHAEAAEPLQPVVFGHLPGGAPGLRRDSQSYASQKSVGRMWEREALLWEPEYQCVWDDGTEILEDLFTAGHRMPLKEGK